MSRLRVSFHKLHDYDPSIRSIWIDGDIFVYTLGFAVEERIEWPDATTEIMGDLNLAKRLLDNRIRHFSNSIVPPASFKMVITGDAPNWRKKLIDASYKAGRGRKPVDYIGLRAYMRNLPMVHETTDGLEADDFLAALASADPNGTAIVSFDKDFFTVPGTFVHLAKNSSARLYRIEPAQAICFLFFQAIVGDPVDSYKGVDDIGKKKAAQMLTLCGLKGLTIRQAYLLLKRTIRAREKQFKGIKSRDLGEPAKDLWKQFRACLDLAALTWDGETPTRGIGLRRVFKYRNLAMTYYLPYYDPADTHKYTRIKL